MTHAIFFKKSDTRVVMDEMEKNRGASREAEGTQRSLVFSTAATITLLGTAGRHCQHVYCTINHSLNNNLVTLWCSDPTLC